MSKLPAAPGLVGLFLLVSFVALSVGAAQEPVQGAATAQMTDDSVTPPQIILETQKPPVYPPAAQAARIGGVVTLNITIQRDGNVGEVKVLACTHPNMGFEKASAKAVKKWRFEPATKDGEPVEYATTFRLNFKRGGSGGYVTAQVSSGETPAGENAPSSSSPGTADRSSGSIPNP